MRAPRIALISAVPTAIPPICDALDQRFSEARVWNLLDDRLLEDATESGGLPPRLRARMEWLIDQALVEGADAVALTCSLYAPVVHEFSRAGVQTSGAGP